MIAIEGGIKSNLKCFHCAFSARKTTMISFNIKIKLRNMKFQEFMESHIYMTKVAQASILNFWIYYLVLNKSWHIGACESVKTQFIPRIQDRHTYIYTFVHCRIFTYTMWLEVNVSSESFSVSYINCWMHVSMKAV